MQRIKSHYDITRCYHEEYKPSFMSRLVAAFKGPIPIYGFVNQVREVIGYIESIEQRDNDLFGVVTPKPLYAKLFDDKYVHVSWYMGGEHRIGLSEGHLSCFPHATSNDGDDGDDYEYGG